MKTFLLTLEADCIIAKHLLRWCISVTYSAFIWLEPISMGAVASAFSLLRMRYWDFWNKTKLTPRSIPETLIIPHLGISFFFGERNRWFVKNWEKENKAKQTNKITHPWGNQEMLSTAMWKQKIVFGNYLPLSQRPFLPSLLQTELADLTTDTALISVRNLSVPELRAEYECPELSESVHKRSYS